MKLSTNGTIGTLIYHLIIILLLVFFGFSYPDPPPQEAGVLVNFGTDDTGFGMEEPAGDPLQGGDAEQQLSAEEAVPVAANPAPKEVAKDNSQNIEESPVKEVKKPTEEEIRLQKIREEELRKQKEQAEILRKQQEAEALKRAQAEKLQKMGETAFGNKGVGEATGSQGITEGTGNQGTPTGTPGADNYGEGGGLGDGISYGLGGRGINGTLPKPLVERCSVTMRIEVKVQIDVDPAGNVTGTPKVLEATYQDACIYEAVLLAARQSKFTSGTTTQRGWIRYIIVP
jgi:hypothetical protein